MMCGPAVAPGRAIPIPDRLQRIDREGSVAPADCGSATMRLVRLSTRRRPAPVSPSAFAGFRFPAEVTSVAVRWYQPYGLSHRDIEELLAERGVEVDHVIVYRWVHTPVGLQTITN
jgi:hypothetical protein